jgi:hypothetical protein
MLKDAAHQDPLPVPESRGRDEPETEQALSLQSQLDRYEIKRVPADAFVWGGYRYSNARDAIAAAKRLTSDEKFPPS